MHKRAPIRAEHHLREECGVFGVFSARRRDLASLVYYGLFALQHRGQESAGIVVNDDGMFADHRGAGLVNEVFSPETISTLGPGNIAVGHVRYATTGSDSRSNIQPLLINHYKGRMALSHNGNLTNAWELRRALEKEGCLFHTTTDSEVIAYTIVRSRLRCPSMEAAVADAMDMLEGAYSLVIASPAKLIAARDIHGFRPLCMGTLSDGSTVFASESCALDAVGAAFVRDIDPGEIVTVDAQGVHSDRRRCGTAPRRGCVFEYIYFARPDSVIDGASVCHARQRAGELLAEAHSVAADVVIGVPDSGLDAAIGYARASGIPYAIGFTKNKYIGRTFIAPQARADQVNIKLSAVEDVVRGRRIVLIDDSIVRGTTCEHLVALLRRAGAKEIHMRVSAPPFRFPCYYGTDIDSQDNLIACRHTADEIAAMIGADSLGYLPAECLGELAGGGHYCSACFTGCYPTAIPAETRKNRFEQKLSEKNRE